MNQEKKNPYIEKDYKKYEDERWISIPKVDVIKKSTKLTKEQLEKAKNFVKFIENETEDRDKKEVL